MKSYFSIIKRSPLFSGMEDTCLETSLKILDARIRTAGKNEVIFSAGEKPRYMGIVLSGRALVVQEDFWGNRTILSALQVGHLFGESFVCAEADSFHVSVIASEDSEILIIDCQSLLSGQAATLSASLSTGLIANLLKILAGKNIMLTRKMEHITKKTTREKILSYLSECAAAAGKDSFEIPFDRQEMADYLSVERSALSACLSKLKADGILLYHKNCFTLFHLQ